MQRVVLNAYDFGAICTNTLHMQYSAQFTSLFTPTGAHMAYAEPIPGMAETIRHKALIKAPNWDIDRIKGLTIKEIYDKGPTEDINIVAESLPALGEFTSDTWKRLKDTCDAYLPKRKLTAWAKKL